MKLYLTYLFALCLVITMIVSCGGTDDNTTSTSSAGLIKCIDGNIISGGSTAQAIAMNKWILNYQSKCKKSFINYSPVGSGVGVSNFIASQLDIAGTDYAPSESDIESFNSKCNGQAVILPVVSGPIDVIYNKNHLKDNLHLTSDILAKIFTGNIGYWDDDSIKALNSSTKLSHDRIIVGYRSDGSGTTYNFSNYLHSTSPSIWTYDVNKNWSYPNVTGFQGLQGSAALKNFVQNTPGAIGYVEDAYHDKNSYVVAVGNNNKFYPPLSDDAKKFISQSKITTNNNSVLIKYDYKKDGYPIVLSTYNVLCKTSKEIVNSFIKFIITEQQQAYISKYGYIPLSSNISNSIKSIIG